MIQSEHVTREELVALLDSRLSKEKTGSIADHLQDCEQCRSEMDQLAAKSEMWQKAPRLLRQSSDPSNGLNLGSGELETRELSPAKSKNGESILGFQSDNILESPKHPEMLGSIGRYDVEREIGRGGMGIVFKAHDAELNRPLAIKVLAPHLANHGPARKRFAQEARSAAGVLHPNVIAVHDVNNEGKTPFIVMPYIAGSSLEALVDKNGPLDEIEIVRIALQIAAGLTPAHAQGLVHRDIKPANILVEHGANRVVITDFGLARAEDDASLTRTGWLTGTPNYMSPEQTRGEKLDNRSDLFSFGSLLYFLATGRLPFRSESPLGVLNRIQNDEPTRIRQVNSRISSTLAGIIHVLLSKQAGHRYQSAGELHDVLEQHLAHLHQPEIAKPPKIKTAGQQNNFAYAAFAVVILLIATTGLLSWNGFFGQPESTLKLFSENRTNDSENSLDQLDETTEKFPNVNVDSNAMTVSVTGMPGIVGNVLPPFDEHVYRVVSSGWKNDRGHDEFNRAMLAHENQQFEDAIKLFAEAAKYDSYQGVANYNIGCAYALKGDEDKAFEYLNKAIGLGFTDIEQFKDDKDLDSLREGSESERFETLLMRLETITEAHTLLSEAQGFANKDDWKSAIESLRQSIKLDATNPETMVYLGYALHMNGQLDEAMKWHQAAANTKEKAALGNYNMACVYAVRQEIENAFEHLELAMDAGLPRVLNSHEIENDSDFSAIQDDQRFFEIVQEAKDYENSQMGSYFQVRRDHDDFMEVISTDWQDDGPVQGDFKIWLTGDQARVSLEQNGQNRDMKWGYSTEFDVDDFQPRLNKQLTKFTLTKRQGKLQFTGEFKRRKGKGAFQFNPDSKYVNFLKEKGIEDPKDSLLFRLYMSDDNEEQFVANLQNLQGLDLDEKTLNFLMVHNVNAELVARYQDMNLEPEDHLVFLIWRVSPKLIQSYNNAGLDLNEYKTFVNRRVEPALIKAYLDAGLDLQKNERFLISRVEPSLLKKYETASLDLEEHKNFIQMRVEPELLRGYREAGLELDKFRDLISSRVQPRQLRSYIAAGFDPDKNRDLLRRQVPAKLLSGYRDANLEFKKMDEFLQARVPASDIKAYENAGLSTKKYKRFLIGRVPANLVRAYEKNGYEAAKFEKLIHNRVAVEWLKKYESAGLDLKKHEDFILQRMEPKKVLKYLQRIEKD